MELKQKLREFKNYKSKLTIDNRSDFDTLVNQIKDLLNEHYRDKMNILEFYETHERSIFNDDLPF